LPRVGPKVTQGKESQFKQRKKELVSTEETARQERKARHPFLGKILGQDLGTEKNPKKNKGGIKGVRTGRETKKGKRKAELLTKRNREKDRPI